MRTLRGLATLMASPEGAACVGPGTKTLKGRATFMASPEGAACAGPGTKTLKGRVTLATPPVGEISLHIPRLPAPPRAEISLVLRARLWTATSSISPCQANLLSWTLHAAAVGSFPIMRQTDAFAVFLI